MEGTNSCSSEPRDLGCTSNIDVLRGFLSLDGTSLIDVGCGSMVFTQLLADEGATVLGIDPDEIQAEANRQKELAPGIRFQECGADELPLDDNSVDGVTFAYSLHHIPASLYPMVFSEVLRVLKPNGFVYVIEPTDCPLNDVMRLFHNEDVVRAEAWESLRQFALEAFQFSEAVTYHSFTEYESWDDFAHKFASRSFNSSYTEADVRRDEVREAFERVGAPDYRFRSEKRVMFLRGMK